MSTFQIPARALKAIGYLAPRKEVREYLRGIHLDRSEDGHLVLVATTGVVAGALKLHAVPEFERYTVSITAVDAALKIARTGAIEVTPERVGVVGYNPVPGVAQHRAGSDNGRACELRCRIAWVVRQGGQGAGLQKWTL